MSSKNTKAGRRASFRYYVSPKWVIRGEHDEWTLRSKSGFVSIPRYAPQGWKVRAWVQPAGHTTDRTPGQRVRATVFNQAYVQIESVPTGSTVTCEMTLRR